MIKILCNAESQKHIDIPKRGKLWEQGILAPLSCFEKTPVGPY